MLELLTAETQRRSGEDLADRSEALTRCLDELTDKARQIVRLRYVEGMRAIDIARQLNRQANAIYVALSRAYRALAECIERRLAEEGTGGCPISFTSSHVIWMAT